MTAAEFHYRVPWRTRGTYPGHHRGRLTGSGFEFDGHTNLLRARDPRRFDTLATLRDPFQTLTVRQYRQPSAVPVYGIADLSASMGFQGACRKLDLLADFIRALGYSAYRTGDPFGFMGCDGSVRDDVCVPLTHHRGAWAGLAERLRRLAPAGPATGLLRVNSRLNRRRSLVFLISDFYLSPDLLETLFASLAYHTVIPVHLEDSAELHDPPGFGFARIVEPETGQQRTLLMRRSLARRLREAAARRRERLARLFTAHGLTPLRLQDRFDAERVTRHFYEAS